MKKVLFFVNGPSPTSAQMKQAFKIEGDVQFRDVTRFDPALPLEKCDGVAGDVPTLYSDKYPQVLPPVKAKVVEEKPAEEKGE